VIKIKSIFHNKNLVALKWLKFSEYTENPSLSAYISADFFASIISRESYKDLNLVLSREEMASLPYIGEASILKRLLVDLKSTDCEKIIISDDATSEFIGDLKISSAIKKKITIDANIVNDIDRAQEYNKKKLLHKTDSVYSQIFLIKHLTGVVKKIVDDESLAESVDQDLLIELYNLLATSDVCWEANFQYTDITKINPRSVMIGGPLLTTEDSPWPGGPNYYEPLCQMPTDLISLFADYDGPNGLAQFYLSESVVSRIINDAEKTTAPKKIIKYILDFRGENTVCEIIGLKPPKVYIHGFEDFHIENIAGLLNATDLHLFGLLELISKDKKVKSPHFMGSFYPVQYDPQADEQCILSIENESDVNLGDAGSAQIFLKNNKLFGAWSCY